MSDLGTIVIDFFIFSMYDPKVLLVSDNSTWLHIEDKPAIIEIKIPGSGRVITYNFLKGGVNSFNSNNLKLTCLSGDCSDAEYSDLPDGIYTITVKGSPDTFQATKYHLKTDRIQQRIDKVLIDMGFEYDKTKTKLRDSVIDIQMVLQIAGAYTRKGDANTAQVYFDTAYTDLTNLENCLED